MTRTSAAKAAGSVLTEGGHLNAPLGMVLARTATSSPAHRGVHISGYRDKEIDFPRGRPVLQSGHAERPRVKFRFVPSGSRVKVALPVNGGPGVRTALERLPEEVRTLLVGPNPTARRPIFTDSTSPLESTTTGVSSDSLLRVVSLPPVTSAP